MGESILVRMRATHPVLLRSFPSFDPVTICTKSSSCCSTQVTSHVNTTANRFTGRSDVSVLRQLILYSSWNRRVVREIHLSRHERTSRAPQALYQLPLSTSMMGITSRKNPFFFLPSIETVVWSKNCEAPGMTRLRTVISSLLLNFLFSQRHTDTA